MDNLSREEFERDLKLRDVNWFYKGTTSIWVSFLRESFKGESAKGPALDLGCGIGGKAIHLKDFSEKVYGLDLSFDALEFCKAETSLPLSQASIEQLPYKDATFSLVNMFDVLEHVEDDMGVLNEIRRVMANDGRLIIAVPAFMSLWSQHDIANFHKRRYKAGALKEKLEKVGFRVRRMSYINFFLFPLVLAYRTIEYRLLRNVVENKRTRVEGMPWFLNNFLAGILLLESRLIKKINFPFGVALLCIAEKSR